jgi:phosphoribosylaminoimidazolecarboxamide formyltransferase/IMP cyclohydrolase
LAQEKELSDPQLDVRPIIGGMLVQTSDNQVDDPSRWTVATVAQPTEQQLRDLEFAWKAARLVKSNAIVYVKDQAVVGLGAGQPNRLESVNLASRKAGDNAKGAALASDAFFPFADGVQLAIDAGITSIIQPGGSVRDNEVIAAANDAGITMVFTDTRHFRH